MLITTYVVYFGLLFNYYVGLVIAQKHLHFSLMNIFKIH